MARTYTLPGVIVDMSQNKGVADSLLVNLGEVLPTIDDLKVLVASQLVLLEDTLDDVRENERSSAAPRRN
jgi:hypothetical protein